MSIEKLKQPSLSEQDIKVNALAQQLSQFTAGIGLDSKVRITTAPARNGDLLIVFAANRQITASWGSGLNEISQGMYGLLFKFLARSFAPPEVSVDALGLLAKPVYAAACLTEIKLAKGTIGNQFLTQLTAAPSTTIPCIYGSTDGLNFAELLETLTCADTLGRATGQKAQIIFSTTGHDSDRSLGMLQDSLAALPAELVGEFEAFRQSLGQTLDEQRIKAAQKLSGRNEVVFIPDEAIFTALRAQFSLGKLLLLAKMAGEDPKLFEGMRASDLIAICTQSKEGQNYLQKTVADVNLKPAGFTYYARETAIAADFPGLVLLPLKMTTHANIYKILGGYGALASQNKSRGAILAPIQRQRIQTLGQAQKGADPCDVLVLGFLAQKFPPGFARLSEDFAETCRVLTPTEAFKLGTKDNRFIIEKYFPLAK